MKKVFLFSILMMQVFIGNGQTSTMDFSITGVNYDPITVVDETNATLSVGFTSIRTLAGQNTPIPAGCVVITISSPPSGSMIPDGGAAAVSETNPLFSWVYDPVTNNLTGTNTAPLGHGTSTTISVVTKGKIVGGPYQTSVNAVDQGDCTSGNNGANDTGRATMSVTAPLPLSLVSFDANKFEKAVNLTWKVADEEKFSHYEIQQSNDAKEFASIGSVEGQNLKRGIYNFTDKNPNTTGVNYYRLKMIDLDGSFDMSKIISVNFDKGLYMEFENPAKSKDFLVKTASVEPTFNLYSSNGSTVDIKYTKSADGYLIKSENQVSGLHFLVMRDNGKTITKKILFKH